MNEQPRPERSGSDIDDLLGAFALDAVDADERELVERHLAADPAARAEVDEMRETASILASLPRDDAGAPSDLWDRIAGAIATPEPEVAAPIPITRAKRRASVSTRVFVAVAAVAAVIIAVLAVQVGTNDNSSNAGNVAAAYDHAVAHGATTVKLSAGAGAPVAAEIALQSDGSGYLRNDQLAALPDGQTYQLWAITAQGGAAHVISAGVLGRDPKTIAFHLAGTPDSFAITAETAPGVVASTHAPVASGTTA